MTEQKGCVVDFWKNSAFDSHNGTYNAYTYRDDLTAIFDKHSPSDLLFLYLPLHNVHGPFQAPQAWLDLYAVNSSCDLCRTYQAIVVLGYNFNDSKLEP